MPTPTFRSSGDLTADRRYAYAVDLFEAGEAAAAADLFEQALELAPAWPVGWFALGQSRDTAGDAAGAALAFARAADLDPGDALGSRLHLARLGALATPQQPPLAYVRSLFDDYADRFDRSLMDRLDYRVPHLIASAIRQHAGERVFRLGLDLGCGTGLLGEALRYRVVTYHGVDLSQGMIDIARSKSVYARLDVSDILTATAALPSAHYDIVTAADVFCYLGDLSQVICQARRITESGGLIAFSVEALPPGMSDDDYRVADSLRFRHSLVYIQRVLEQAGLEVLHLQQEALRNDRGIPIEGHIVVASIAGTADVSER